MKRTRRRESGKKPKKAGSVAEMLKGVDLNLVREQIANQVGNRAMGMVESAMADADGGHYQAMKYLFEMVGLCRGTTPEGRSEEDTLAKVLLRRLNLPDEPNPGTDVTKEGIPDGAPHKSDAVE
jgi:hypothetical protein